MSGAFTVTQRAGLRRTDTLWKAFGKAAVLLHGAGQPNPPPLVLLTTNALIQKAQAPRLWSSCAAPAKPIQAVVKMDTPGAQLREHTSFD